MGTVVQFPNSAEAWVTADQLCRHLGVKSRRTIERWVKAGMPSQKFGGQRRFKISEVEAWHREREAGDAA